MKAHWFFVFAVLWLTSCGGPETGSDELEKTHPVVVEASKRLKQQDTAGAATLLEGLLREQPDVAYAHLQLGYVFQTQEEPVKALYHFQRYLEMRSGTKNTEVVQIVVQDELRRLARRVGTGQEPTDIATELEELRVKLELTERKLIRARTELSQASLGAGSISSEPPPAWAAERAALLQEIATLREGPQTADTSSNNQVVVIDPQEEPSVTHYTVLRGDNLSLIAKKHYGKASEWRKIFDANRDQLATPRDLSVGMDLKIPE